MNAKRNRLALLSVITLGLCPVTQGAVTLTDSATETVSATVSATTADGAAPLPPTFGAEASSLTLGKVAFSGTAIETVTKADNTTLLPDGSLVLVVVDRSRDGFGGVLADLGLRVGDRLDTYVGDADNVIVGFNVVDDIGFPGAVAAALGRAQFEVDSEQSGINQGDPFGILVFDGLTGSDRVITDPTIHYGFATSADWIVPAAGSKMQFGSAAAPGEYPMLSTLSASVQVVAIPEPEGTLLGAMAAMAILMRRRRTGPRERGKKA